jgi:hypothetical protein
VADQSLVEYDSVSIVLLGAFNPRIFQPAWFVREGLLSAEAESGSQIELINNDYCAFQTDWCRIEVLPDRFMAITRAAPIQDALRDLVLGAFTTLRHTPVAKIGMNSHGHFELRDDKSWHQFGHVVAPKGELWDPILRNPGTLTVEVQAERTDGRDGHLRVKVQPSTVVPHGIFIETNSEVRSEDTESAGWLTDVLTQGWSANREEVSAIRDHLLAFA